jgi:phenylpropionate dioxygenase-like ring-hydroxylating dioxygenase large terminal subunit
MYAPAAIPDFAALRKCWHPVGYSKDLKGEPRRVQLLDELIALWRDSSGTAHAFADMCIHRGTALSIGRVVGDEIVCPYHGWRFASSGACTAIPQLEDPTRIPSKARVPAYQCQERYGLLWVSLEEPRWALPEISEYESGDFNLVFNGPYEWRADSSRQLENFTDFGHFAWVHPGILGDPDRPVVPKHTVEAKDHVLHYEVARPEALRNEEFPVFFNEGGNGIRHSIYEIHLPYTIVMRSDWGGAEKWVHLFCSQPAGANKCIGYAVIGRNYDRESDPKCINEYEDTVFGQDKRIVEEQRPEFVPFDLADELHMSFDAVAVNYRKKMREVGLARRLEKAASAHGR